VRIEHRRCCVPEQNSGAICAVGVAVALVCFCSNTCRSSGTGFCSFRTRKSLKVEPPTSLAARTITPFFFFFFFFYTAEWPVTTSRSDSESEHAHRATLCAPSSQSDEVTNGRSRYRVADESRTISGAGALLPSRSIAATMISVSILLVPPAIACVLALSGLITAVATACGRCGLRISRTKSGACGALIEQDLESGDEYWRERSR